MNGITNLFHSDTKWRPLGELSAYISNTIFGMKATVLELPSYLFVTLNSQKLRQKQNRLFP